MDKAATRGWAFLRSLLVAGSLLGAWVWAGLAGEPEPIVAIAFGGDEVSRSPNRTKDVPPEEPEAGADGVFLFAAPEHQGIVEPRSGRLCLSVTDLSIRAGASGLHLQRRLRAQAATEGLLGTRWRFDWEIHLDRLGRVAVIDDPSGPVLLSATSDREFRSPAGEKLIVGDEQSTYTRLDGGIDVFDADGRLVRREIRGGEPLVLTYDAQGRLSRIDGPRGSFVQFVLDDAGRVTRARGSNGSSVQYAFSDGELAEVASDQGAVAYRYAEQGRLSRIEHPQFGSIALGYDDRGRVLSRQWIDGTRETWAYDDPNRAVRHTDAAGAVTTYRTSADHRREETIDALGHKTVVVYDEAGQVHQVTGPTGQTVTNTYDDRGRIARMETSRVGSLQFEYRGESRQPISLAGPSGRSVSFDYDADENLIGVDESGSPGVAFEYGPAKTIEKVAACNGREVSFAHDDQGRLKSISHAQGIGTEFEYDSAGNLVREKDPLGGVTSRTYDKAGRLTSVREPDGATTQYRYSPGGLLTETVDPSGATTRYRYRGRTIEVTDPADRTTVYAYDAAGRLEGITDAKGGCSRFEYDAAGNLVRLVDPLGGATTRAYDALGRLIEETAADGGATRFEYGEDGRLQRIAGPAGQSEHYEYDAKGRLTKASDAAGRETRYEYDDAGRVARVVDAAGRETRYEYTSCGLVTKILPPDGPATELAYNETGDVVEASRADHVVTYEYDALGQPVKQRHPGGLEIACRYDALGNLLTYQDSLGGQRSMRYDQRGRLVEFVDSAGAVTRLRYDLAGNLLSATDPRERVKRFSYTEAGELNQVVEPNGDTARYEYDGAGNLAAVEHPSGGRSEYVYDAAGNVRRATDPRGNARQSTYDDAGRLTGTTDAKGRKTTYAYDAAGRLIQKRLADGKVIGYRYDEYGNLAEVDDGVFPVRYEYDVFGNATRIEYPAIDRALRYEYDARGRLAKFTDSEGGTVVYCYDLLDRLASIEAADGETISFAYDPKGRLARRVYPNGVTGSWEYDGEDRVVQILYADSVGEVVSRRRYRYDPAGHPVEITHGDEKTIRYEYDEAGQLISETTLDGRTIQYAYAPGGNRATREAGGKTTAYRYDEADRLLQAGDEAFAYDADGNLIERKGPDGTTRYEYDAEDRLVKVGLPDGEEVRFGYAPTGERIWRQDGAGRTYFVTDGANLLAELDDDLKATAVYLHGPGIDQPLAMRAGGERYAFHADAVGTVTALTDSDARLAATYHTGAFGDVAAATGATANPFVFTGREYDAKLGLYYYRARYYDPKHGRFLQVDSAPIDPQAPLSLNPYAYAWNCPGRFVDPWGTAPVDHFVTPLPHEIESIPAEVGYYRGIPPARAIPALEEAISNRRIILGGHYGQFDDSGVGMFGGRSVAGERVRISVYEAELARQRALAADLAAHPARPAVTVEGGRSSSSYVPRQQPSSGGRPPGPQAGGGAPAATRIGPDAPGPTPGGLAPTGRAPSPAAQPTRIGAAGRSPHAPTIRGPAPSAEPTRIGPAGRSPHAPTIAGPVAPASGFRPWLNQNPGMAMGVIGAIGIANCAYWSDDPTSCVLGRIPWIIGAKAVSMVVGAKAATIAFIPIAAYQTGKGLAEAGIEGAGYWTARQAAADAERRARQTQEAVRGRGDQVVTFINRQIDELAGIRERILAARRNAKSGAQAAIGAEKSVQSGLATLRLKQKVLDAAADNAMLAPHIRDEVAAGAQKAEQGERSVHATLDAADAQARQVSSREQQKQVLDAYANAERLVSEVVDAAERTRARNADLAKIVWAAGQARREAETLPQLKKSMEDGATAARRSLDSAYSHLEEAARLTEAWKQGAATLAGRIGRARTLLGAESQGLDDLQSRLAAVASLPADDASPLAAAAQAAVDRIEPILRQAQAIAADGLDLGEGVAAADEAVARAEAAEKRAVDRLARSRALRDQVAAWAPGQRPGATDAPDFGQGITVVGPEGGDPDAPPDFGAGITVVTSPGMNDADPPPDFGQGIAVVEPPVEADSDRRPDRAGAPAVESPERRIAADEPLYAVYGIHPWSVPAVPESIRRMARSRNAPYTASLSRWIDGLTVRDMPPANYPASFLAFRVSGEVLQDYQAHVRAGKAGEGGEDYRLFRYGGFYHQTFTITTPVGHRFQAPLFLSFQALFSGGEPPEKFSQAKVSLLGPTVEFRAMLPMNDRRVPGGGWHFADGNKVRYTAGPIEYDGAERWSDATHRLALEHAKQVLRTAVQAGIGVGEAVGEAIGEAFGSGFF